MTTHAYKTIISDTNQIKNAYGPSTSTSLSNKNKEPLENLDKLLDATKHESLRLFARKISNALHFTPEEHPALCEGLDTLKTLKKQYQETIALFVNYFNQIPIEKLNSEKEPKNLSDFQSLDTLLQYIVKNHTCIQTFDHDVFKNTYTRINNIDTKTHKCLRDTIYTNLSTINTIPLQYKNKSIPLKNFIYFPDDQEGPLSFANYLWRFGQASHHLLDESKIPPCFTASLRQTFGTTNEVISVICSVINEHPQNIPIFDEIAQDTLATTYQKLQKRAQKNNVPLDTEDDFIKNLQEISKNTLLPQQNKKSEKITRPKIGGGCPFKH